jgi:hypothetical protein
MRTLARGLINPLSSVSGPGSPFRMTIIGRSDIDVMQAY